MSRVLTLILILSFLCFAVQFSSADPGDFVRGDADGNGVVNGLVDALFVLAFQFQMGPTPPCLEAADVDGNGNFNGLTDALYLLGSLFGCCQPPPPYPFCGPDPDPGSSLGCKSHPCF